jgi:hypothetical protein
MAYLPEKPQERVQGLDKSIADEAQRHRQRRILSLLTIQSTADASLGDMLLPFLAAAIETCWIDAIFVGLAGLGLFGSRDPLMPLWAPFVIVVASQWILSRLELRAVPAGVDGEKEDGQGKGTLPGSSLLIVAVGVSILFLIWVSVYARGSSLFNPRWLLSLLNDVLLLDLRAFHIFFIVAITAYLCWRAVRLLHRVYEPSHIFGMLRLGLGIILGVILVRAVQASSGVIFNDDGILLLLVAIFLFLALAAHALARVNFVRRTHASGIEGDIVPHERAILGTISIVGIIMLLTAWIVDLAASPTILRNTQQLFNILGRCYDWLVNILALVFAVLAAPLFLLIDWGLTRFPLKFPTLAPANTRGRPPHVLPHDNSITPIIVPFLHILLPVLLIVVAVFLLRWTLQRRRRVRVAMSRRRGEMRESLWSWRLFKAQFRALLRALFGRFWPGRAARPEPTANLAAADEPGVLGIREVYRAFLRRAAARGYPRQKNETPFEFQQRLNEQTPLAQAHIAPLTEAYAAARYGGAAADEAEVARVQREWMQLEQKWRQPQGS